MSYADQVTLLAEGRTVASGAAPEVLITANLETVYDIPLEIVRTASAPHPIIVART